MAIWMHLWVWFLSWRATQASASHLIVFYFTTAHNPLQLQITFLNSSLRKVFFFALSTTSLRDTFSSRGWRKTWQEVFGVGGTLAGAHCETAAPAVLFLFPLSNLFAAFNILWYRQSTGSPCNFYDIKANRFVKARIAAAVFPVDFKQAGLMSHSDRIKVTHCQITAQRI